MSNVGRISQIKTAYEKVVGKSVDAEVAVKTFDDLMCNFNAYPDESEDAKRIRLKEVDSPTDYDNISRWIMEFDVSIFPNNLYSVYERAFYIITKSGDGIVEKSAVSSDDTASKEKTKVEDFSDNNVSQIKTTQEDTHMNEDRKEVTSDVSSNQGRPWEELQKQYGAGGTGPAGDPVANSLSNVSSVSEDVKKAASEIISQTQSERIQFSRNTKIVNALITKVIRTEKAVAGKAAKGTVSNPRKCYEKFCACTGYDDSTGEPVFTKLAPGESVQNAREMLNILKKSIEDPSYEVEVYFGAKDEPSVSIKGYNVRMADGKEETLSVSDMTKLLLSQTIGVLNFENVADAQIAVESARISSKRQAKKPYTVRIANRQKLIEDESASIVIKNKTPQIDDQKGGFKSSLAVKYKGDKLTTGGEAKIMTYRIPLNVEQYKYEVMSQYSELIKKGIGNQKTAVDINDNTVIDELVKSMADIVAATSVSKVGTSVLDSSVLENLNTVRGNIAEQNAQAQSKELDNLDI